MAPEINTLCLAIVAYLGFGESAFPRHDRDKVIEIFGHELLENVLSILGEVDRLEVDWSAGLSLADAGKLVRGEMEQRHPEFSDLALDAIAWKYTFDWR